MTSRSLERTETFDDCEDDESDGEPVSPGMGTTRQMSRTQQSA